MFEYAYLFPDKRIHLGFIPLVIFGGYHLGNYTRVIEAYLGGFVEKNIFRKRIILFREIEDLSLYIVDGGFRRGITFGYTIRLKKHARVSFDGRIYKNITEFIHTVIGRINE